MLQHVDSASNDRNSRTAEAYAALKAAISSGDLQSGERLWERALAKKLKMSRTPVREALQRLVNEGLTEARSDGLYVRALSVEDVRSLEEANRALQGMAAQLAASRGSETDMDKLGEIMARMEACAAALDPDGWIATDREIHRHLFQMAKNRWLTKLLLQLGPLIGRVQHIGLRRPGRMEQSTREHRLIVDAVKARAAQAAQQAMHDHLLRTERNMIEILETFVVPWKGDRL
jgi:DNA-binding GntR family transcriptional regulator